MMSINAVKGVEIGDGFAAAALTGEDNADEMRIGNDGRPLFLSNHAGGILGGISTGQPIVVRFAVKPTSSILKPRRTIDRHGRETEIVTKGRHDPCVGIRAVPVGEAMMALVLADHLLAPPRRRSARGARAGRMPGRVAASWLDRAARERTAGERTAGAAISRRPAADRVRWGLRALLGLCAVRRPAGPGADIPLHRRPVAARPGAVHALRSRPRQL